MRQLSKKKIEILGKTVGGNTPLICVPLCENNRDQLIEAAVKAIESEADIVEWRADAFEPADCEEILTTLRQLHAKLPMVPLIFTCRRPEEGGLQQAWNSIDRLELIERVAASRHVHFIDTELGNDDDYVEAIAAICAENSVKLILSYHNFQQTPDEKVILDNLLKAERAGADIAKIAVTPNCYTDVLTLLSATNRARIDHLQIPMITISMGLTGVVSRIAGGLFGSDITFATAARASAPGQLPVAEMRQAMSLLY